MDTIYRCLIVEDELYSAKLIADYLKNIENFYSPRIAHNIFDALEEIRNNRYDLIFCDIHLPDGNAMDLIKSISLQIPVIMITGDKDQSLEAYQMDIIDYVLKPVTQTRFDKALRKFFEVVSGRKQLQQNNSFLPLSGNINNLEKILITRFGLSPAESSICRSIVDGKKPEEILNFHSISKNTYKTHMRKIFSKTIDMNVTDAQKSQGKLQRLTLFLLELNKEGH